MISTIDHAIFFFFQGLQRPWLDYFLAWPTYLGDTKVLLSFLLPAVLIFDKKNAFRTIAAISIALLIVGYASPTLKELFHRPRPHIFWENVHVIFAKPHNDAFPSGHAMVIFAAMFMLSHYYPKLSPWFYAAAVWVGMTRVYVGAHYPTDIVGGMIFGVLCGWLASVIVKFYSQRAA